MAFPGREGEKYLADSGPVRAEIERKLAMVANREKGDRAHPCGVKNDVLAVSELAYGKFSPRLPRSPFEENPSLHRHRRPCRQVSAYSRISFAVRHIYFCISLL